MLVLTACTDCIYGLHGLTALYGLRVTMCTTSGQEIENADAAQFSPEPATGVDVQRHHPVCGAQRGGDSDEGISME